MRLPPYQRYKPSGDAWVPELPESWDLVRLRWLSERYAGGTPDKSNSAFWDDGDIPWLNSGAVNDGYITEPSEYITREGFLGSSAKWTPKGALVMALAGQGKTKGMVAQLGFAATCNQSMAAIIPIQRIRARYLYWWLTANYFNIRNMAGGEARDGLNLELLGGIPCPVPGNDAQRAIADFLDRETAKIDTLVEKKRTLIERLKEKRTALISRTVTRGLPPDAARAADLDPHPKLKPSGIDWLGDVPEHWEVLRLRYASIVLDCKHKTVSFVDDGVPLASIQVHGFSIDLSAAKQTTEEEYLEMIDGGRAPQVGDIIYSRNATVGDAALVDTQQRFCMGQDVCLIRASKHHARFLLYLLRSASLMEQVESLMIGSTFRRINVGQIKAFWICLPPGEEQEAIAAYLDRETRNLDGMVAKVELAIERLQEYRSALITAAVTGKIDLRGAVA